jgi:glycosyltransferase involved in cell wall biosynthesis
MPLKVSLKIDQADRQYYESYIRPLIQDNPNVELIGELNEQEKTEFLGNAYAVLFPIRWPEPFGLVMIEAMACGTPVIATRFGSVPEVMEHGASGFIVDTVDEAVQAVEQARTLSRERVRQVFEERFTVAKMVDGYEAVYAKLVEETTAQALPA